VPNSILAERAAASPREVASDNDAEDSVEEDGEPNQELDKKAQKKLVKT